MSTGTAQEWVDLVEKHYRENLAAGGKERVLLGNPTPGFFEEIQEELRRRGLAGQIEVYT